MVYLRGQSVIYGHSNLSKGVLLEAFNIGEAKIQCVQLSQYGRDD
jgi:hypothetical protein